MYFFGPALDCFVAAVVLYFCSFYESRFYEVVCWLGVGVSGGAGVPLDGVFVVFGCF